MRLADIAGLLSKVDPARVQSIFPSKDDQEKFEGARKLVLGILDKVKHKSLDPATLEQIEVAASAFRDLCKRISSSTELGSKATLNEAVLYSELGYLERSIFLAGVAREKKVREPYRSQLNSLPSHACCSRFRQMTKISESVKTTVDAAVFEYLRPLFDELRRSYLAQFVYFASQAYMMNRDHPMVAYMQSLACLMKAYELELQGRENEAEALTMAGYEAVRALPEPTEKSHYMELTYHKMNAAEFAELRRLSARHAEVHHRLTHLAGRASRLKDDHAGRTPVTSYAIAPIIGWGARSASVVGLLISAASLLGWDQASIHAAVNALWAHAAEQIPQISEQASNLVAQAASQAYELTSHTGGLAAHTGGIAAHTGGVAGQLAGLAAELAALSAHNGGFA